MSLCLVQVGVRQYVKCLELAAIGTLDQFGVRGYTTEHTGVWSLHPRKGECKICSIGEPSHTPHMGGAMLLWPIFVGRSLLQSCLSLAQVSK